MADYVNDEDWLQATLGRLSAVRGASITGDAEIYYDLRISGLDLDELLGLAAQRCGAPDLMLSPGRYAPGEPGDWFDWLFRSRDRRRYDSLTVTTLLDAMAATRKNAGSL